MARQFKHKHNAATQCELWAASYNDNGQIHAFGFPEIGYIAFEREPGLYSDSVCGVVSIGMYWAEP